MGRQSPIGAALSARRLRGLLLAAGLVGFAAWAVFSAGRGMLSVGTETLRALWLLPALVALHLGQLFLSSRAWGDLLPATITRLRLYRLRIIREGIDSLLPVAQVGGEVVAARLLSRDGPPLAETAASVIVDVTVEFLTQLLFLLIAVAALAAISPEGAWEGWASAVLLTAAAAGGLLAAQRFGFLRLLEALARQIAVRWPSAGSLAGLDEAASAIYRRRSSMLQASGLHLFAWLLGSIESWAVLWALGYPVGPVQALTVEALGMAARSAGFAIPGALVVQETGFALAAAAVGLPELPGVSLSLVKRAREVTVGLLGLALWWAERRHDAKFR